MALAAGPERMVSTGFCTAISQGISEPSPFTIISGALIPSSFMENFTALINSCITATRDAFRQAVAARLIESIFVES